MGVFQRLEFDLPAGADDERLVGELWSAGTLGLECRDRADGGLRIIAYFDRRAAARGCAARITAACPEAALRRRSDLPDTDWLALYRRRARPFHLGRRLLIDPGEPRAGVVASEGRRLLRLPARRAFGTGEHASTRLVAEWLEDLDLADREVLDVGCGSGILSFAALLGGARRVVALEIDPVAALIARQNQRLNGLVFALAAGAAGCLRPIPRFDLLLVNVLPESVRRDLPALRRLLAAGGRAVFSGILDAAVPAVEERLRRHGFAPAACRRRDGWSALLTAGATGRRPAPAGPAG